MIKQSSCTIDLLITVFIKFIYLKYLTHSKGINRCPHFIIEHEIAFFMVSLTPGTVFLKKKMILAFISQP